MKKIICRGEMIPPFYGVSYHLYHQDKAVCYPLIINLIVIIYRDFIFWMKNPKGM